MGLSLSLSGVPGKSAAEVVNGLKKYLNAVDGGIEQAEINKDHKNFCTIQQADGNTTIFYPPYFFKCEECSKFLSVALNAAVFSFDIFDGDFWTYTLFVEGNVKDHFMPIPDYFDDEITKKEIDTCKGDAKILAKYIPGLNVESIEKYLVRWDLDREEAKAYEDDEFTNCEYQLIDFLRKLQLPCPIDEEDNITGESYKFWTKDLPLESGRSQNNDNRQPLQTIKEKPWWKFW